LGKSVPRQSTKRGCGLGDIKLRMYRDFGLGVFAMPERDQA
jgi:hypothetical protein